MVEIILYLLKHSSDCFNVALLYVTVPAVLISYGLPCFSKCACISKPSLIARRGCGSFHAPTHSLSHRGKSHIRWAQISATAAWVSVYPACLSVDIQPSSHTVTPLSTCLAHCTKKVSVQQKKKMIRALSRNKDIVMIFFFSTKKYLCSVGLWQSQWDALPAFHLSALLFFIIPSLLQVISVPWPRPSWLHHQGIFPSITPSYPYTPHPTTNLQLFLHFVCLSVGMNVCWGFSMQNGQADTCTTPTQSLWRRPLPTERSKREDLCPQEG